MMMLLEERRAALHRNQNWSRIWQNRPLPFRNLAVLTAPIRAVRVDQLIMPEERVLSYELLQKLVYLRRMVPNESSNTAPHITKSWSSSNGFYPQLNFFFLNLHFPPTILWSYSNSLHILWSPPIFFVIIQQHLQIAYIFN